MKLVGMTVEQMCLSIALFRSNWIGIPMNNIDFLGTIAEADVARLIEKGKHYGDSWKKRGGVGAFMMLARKWDRIEQRMQHRACFKTGPGVADDVPPYDIFGHIRADTRDEGLLDDIRDLRSYLLLVESEIARLNVEKEDTECQS